MHTLKILRVFVSLIFISFDACSMISFQFFVLLNYKIQNSRTKQYILAIFLENAQTMRMHKQFNSMYVRMLYLYFVFTGFIFIWVVHLFLM